MTDKQKGWLLTGIGVIGYLTVWLLIGNRFSLMYGIPAILLYLGHILLTTDPRERQARPVFKVLGIILITLLIGFMVVAIIIEITYLTR